MDINKKIEIWKKKLLDTGRRNRLINYKPSTNSTLEIVNKNFFEIIERLQNGATYQMASLFNVALDIDDVDDKKKIVEANGKIYPKKDRYDEEEILEIATKFKGKRGVNYLFSTTITNLERACLFSLRKKSNLFYEETGVNALYIAFGFLEYIDPIDNTRLLAPLCLMPIKIERNSIKDTYKISLIDDDFIVNETLLYKLKIDYKLDLENTAELELKQYLDYVTKSVAKYSFKVINKISISLFSFAKMKMYTDLNEHKDLIANNEIIKALCQQEADISNFEEVSIDLEKLDEKDVYQVLNADSSQRMAIEYAKKGISFVLQGPPGTGKSQTITNIIGELIANNKSVLFVCEKKAALEVVYRNLEKNNLAKFALPLHDPKTNKKEIITDLCNNLYQEQEYQETLNNRAYEVFEKHNLNKERLARYKDALHSIRKPINKSVYEIMNLYQQYTDAPNLEFEVKNPLLFDMPLIDEYRRMVAALAKSVSVLDCNPRDHAFFGLKPITFGVSDKNALKSALQSLNEGLTSLITMQRTMLALNFKELGNINDLTNSITYLKSLKGDLNIPVTNYDYKHNEELLEKAKKLEIATNDVLQIKQTIAQSYNNNVYNLDFSHILEVLNSSKGLFKGLNKQYRRVKKSINAVLIEDKKCKYKQMVNLVKQGIQYNECMSSIKNLEVDFISSFGENYFGLNTDFNKLMGVISYLVNYENSFALIEEGFDNKDLFINHYLSDLIVKQRVEELIPELEALEDKIKNSIIDLKSYFQIALEELDIAYLHAKTKLMLNSFTTLATYSNYAITYDKIHSQMPLMTEMLVNQDIDYQDYEKAFLKRLYGVYLDAIIQSDEVLGNFSSDVQDICVAEFANDDNLVLEIAKAQVKENVIKYWPRINGIMGKNLEVQTLLAEANKKRKIKPLRMLFKEVPNILLKLKPVFMMSPLSVSTFIDPNLYHFDTIIFDEASQLTSENAIGSIYRAKQIIVVGDSEQLPPTSFFNSEEYDEEDDTYDVYESILDEAQSALPKIMLKWHYRSLDESLITFSNNEIYHGLTTFPSAKQSDGLGVKYEYVDCGIYERGLRVNKLEAQRVVDLIYDHYQKTPFKSLGVVTFNQSQQMLIEKMLNKRLDNDNSIEKYLFPALNPLFIKNLETVQGDERDSIILSICFAKDKSNKLSMNFGPINQNGGYKRLNVAITRAKEQLILVGSILPGDFNLSKTDSKGVLMLKKYIEYAINVTRGQNLFENQNGSNETLIDVFAKALTEAGYECIRNLGSSEYKIDIAVKSKNSKDYLLAIMFDGYSYTKFKNSKDREHLRLEVIKSRGWNVASVWSTSLVFNFQMELNKILKLLSDIANKQVEAEPAQDAIVNEELVFTVNEKVSTVTYDEMFAIYPAPSGVIKRVMKDYSTHQGQLSEVIKALAPIKIEALKKIILPLYDKTKLTALCSKQMDDELNVLVKEKKIYKLMGFILKPSDLSHVNFRIHCSTDDKPRDISDIYIEELEDGMYSIIKEVKLIDKQSLFATMNKLLGYSKTTEKINLAYENVLAMLLDKQMIQVEDDNIRFQR